MPTIVELNADQAALAQRLVEAGRFSSVGDVVAALFRGLQREEEQRIAFARSLDDAMAEGERDGFISLDDALAEADAIIAGMK